MENQYIPIPIAVEKERSTKENKENKDKKDSISWSKTIFVGIILTPVIIISTLTIMIYFNEGLSITDSIKEAFKTVPLIWG